MASNVFTLAEIAVALLAFVTPTWRWTHWGLLGTFIVFFFVSFGKWWSGATSCGCFGAWIVPPIFTMTLDLSIIVLLLVTLVPRDLLATRPSAISVLAILPLFGVVGAMTSTNGNVRSTNDARTALEAMAARHDLTHERIAVLIYRSDCGHCRTLRDLIANGEIASEWHSIPWVLLEVPAMGSPSSRTSAVERPSAPVVESGVMHITTDAAWNFHVPTLAVLDGGQVERFLDESEVQP